MLEFVKDGGVMHSEELQSVDSVTLETYGELACESRNMLLCILMCEGRKQVYLASSIVAMRYSVVNGIRVYKLRDPVTRVEVDEILYFETEENPLYLKHGDASILNAVWDGGVNKETIDEESNLFGRKTEDAIVKAVYIGNEVDLLCSKNMQKKILGIDAKTPVHRSVLYRIAKACTIFSLMFFLLMCFFYAMMMIIVRFGGMEEGI
ncbi:hypothetical protein HK407_01g00990 [Ordospora pajunii]|uniref:uncharacterized protein n=1 Tax=Ordospora pajunii TaxID=3039483 RepID=UPI0029525F99|nr:uncharacterized protein HK407_01g00990 [Ordospora pajunii]KAH9412206.1 hypothetical protein HK407_01g00990 [Ordospora pajunii]